MALERSIPMTSSVSTVDELTGFSGLDPDLNLPAVQSAQYFNEDSFKTLVNSFTSPFDKFATLFLNIRSAVKNLQNLQEYLDVISFHFPVIGLAETWLSPDNEHLYNFNTYQS